MEISQGLVEQLLCGFHICPIIWETDFLSKLETTIKS